MAPEQALGHKLDRRADLFSLGSVLYQMAAGRPPFRATGTLAVLKRVAEDTPRPIREIIPETPQWLCAIIAKLHAKKPDDRYQSAREVADVLADCEGQLRTDSRLKDFSRIPRGKAHASGRRVWVTAAVLLLAAVVMAVTEAAGLTDLFRGRATNDPIKPGVEPTPGHVAKPSTVVPQEPLPPAFTNSIGMEFVIVPKGKAWLGGGKDRLGDREVEVPADFYLGKYEVTQEEWHKVMGKNPSHFSRTGKDQDVVKDTPDADLKWFPAENVSWFDCQLFVAKLNSLGREPAWVYRLPTETEWEYACRGGPMSDERDSAFDYYFAIPTNTLLPEKANFNTGSNRVTHKVGSFEANRLGLFDMHGNVWEWCDDTERAADGSTRGVFRGGSWQNQPWYYRAVSRHATDPATNRFGGLGLRVARVPAAAAAPEVKVPAVAPAPFTDADVKRIAALPAAGQVEEVRKELRKRNPGFDGALTPTIENAAVTGLEFATDRVTDISPVRALARLRTLVAQGSGWDKGLLADLTPLRGLSLSVLRLDANNLSDLGPLQGMPLDVLSLWQWHGSDLTPLRGMPLKWLNCGGRRQRIDLAPLAGLPLDFLCVNHTQASDLTPLKGMPLTTLMCGDSPVSDLAPLRGVRLERLYANRTKVSDLAPLDGMPMVNLEIEGAPVTDLSPLKALPLKRLGCDFQAARDAKVLRAIKTLETINGKPAAEFWKNVKGE